MDYSPDSELPELIKLFVEADWNLLQAVYNALVAFQENPAPEWEETVHAWQICVHANLHDTHVSLEEAQKEYLSTGNPRKILHYAEVQLGLARHIEWWPGWATLSDAETITNGVEKVVYLAYCILMKEKPQMFRSNE